VIGGTPVSGLSDNALTKLRREFPVGAAGPARAIATQRAYVRAFLNRYLLDRTTPLLEPGAQPLPGVSLLIRTH